jgi:hypothetical protein
MGADAHLRASVKGGNLEHYPHQGGDMKFVRRLMAGVAAAVFSSSFAFAQVPEGGPG